MSDRSRPAVRHGLDDMRLLRAALNLVSAPEATLVLLMLLTLQSPRDIVRMDWRDLDLPGGLWILPGLPHRTALLSSAAIATLISRAHGGAKRQGLVVHDGVGGPLGHGAAISRGLGALLPDGVPTLTPIDLHRAAWREWERTAGAHLPSLVVHAGKPVSLAEQVRLRHAIRFALDEWARLLR